MAKKPVHKEEENLHLFNLSINIGDGRTDNLSVFLADDPELLSQTFAQKFELGKSLQNHLTKLISDKKAIFKKRAWSKIGFGNKNVPSRLFPKQKQAPKKKKCSLINYGQWLYTKGVSLKQRTASTSKLLGHERTQSFSFQPLINEYSHIIASPRYCLNTEDMLLNKQQQYSLNLKKLQAEALEQEARLCPFTPKILNRKLRSTSRLPSHQRLHLDADLRRTNRQRMSDEARQESSKYYPNSTTVKKVRIQDQEASADRLLGAKKQFNAKIQEARSRAKRDELQGKFIPRINKTPVKERLGESSSVHDYLYAKKDDLRQKVVVQSQEDKKHAESVVSSKKPSGSTTKIYEQFRGKQYGNLFILMDGNRSGTLSSGNLAPLDTKTMTILAPFMDRIEAGQEITVEGFVSGLEALWPQLSVEEKAVIMRRRRQQNPKAPEVRKQGKIKSLDGIYLRTKDYKRIVEIRSSKQRDMKEAQESKQCTFKPVVNRPRVKKQVINWQGLLCSHVYLSVSQIKGSVQIAYQYKILVTYLLNYVQDQRMVLSI